MTANTTTFAGNTINITLTADADWGLDSSTELAAETDLVDIAKLVKGGIPIDSIEFCGTHKDDKVTIRECSTSGQIIFKARYNSYTQYMPITKYFNSPVRGIYIDKDDVASDDDAAMVIIRLK
jgi:hypothetical protein